MQKMRDSDTRTQLYAVLIIHFIAKTKNRDMIVIFSLVRLQLEATINPTSYRQRHLSTEKKSKIQKTPLTP